MSTGVVLTRVETLSLYRHLLKSAYNFPSKRRTSIVLDIRTDFRKQPQLHIETHQGPPGANVGETDKEKIKGMVKEAETALFEMTRFNSNKGHEKDWSYTQV